MISSRQVVVAAASLFAALAAMPPSVQADNKPSSGNAATNPDNDNDNKRHESKGRRDDDQGEKRGSFGKSQGGQNSKGEKPSGFQFDNKRTPGSETKKFGNQPPPKPPVVNEFTKNAPPSTFSKTPPNTEKFKAEDKNKRGFQKHFGDQDNNGAKSPPTTLPTRSPRRRLPATNSKRKTRTSPVSKNISETTTEIKNRSTNLSSSIRIYPARRLQRDSARTAPKALSAGDARKRFRNPRSSRKEKVEAGGKVVIEEPGKRTMFKAEQSPLHST